MVGSASIPAISVKSRPPSLGRSTLMVPVLMIGLPLAGCGTTSSTADQSKHDAARRFSHTIVSVMEVQECPTVFEIKPEYRAEVEANMRRFYKEGMEKRLATGKRSEQDCLARAKEYFAGPQSLRYLGMTAAARKRLQ